MNSLFANESEYKTYIPIPYRDRARPPISRWEIQAAEKRLREAGYARVDEALIFQAVEEMRDRPPRKPITTSAKPDASAVRLAENDEEEEVVEAFDGIGQGRWRPRVPDGPQVEAVHRLLPSVLGGSNKASINGILCDLKDNFHVSTIS